MKHLSRILLFATAVCALLGQSLGEPPRKEFVLTVKNGKSVENINRKFGTVTLKQIPGTSVYLVREQAGSSVALTNLQSDDDVEAAETNSQFRLGDTDTIFLLDTSSRTILNGSDVPAAYANQAALSIVQADQVRSISTGAGTRVAYVDTGVDFYHPALRPWLDPGIDLVSGQSASEFEGLSSSGADLADTSETIYLLDTDTVPLGDSETLYLLSHGFGRLPKTLPPAVGHGTLVAGVIHAVAPDAVIVPIRAFDAFGNTSMFTIVESVYRAMDLNIDVLNMSFSTAEDSKTLRKAVTAAQDSGITVVSSMGNQGRDVGDVFPAAYSSVIGVSATDLNDRLASFSNYGKSVSIAAPGSYVISTAIGGRYAAAWGTSFSAPLVSGTVALISSLRSRGHSEAPLVLATAEQLTSAGMAQIGRGRLNTRKALDRLNNDK